ncbi:fimbrial protein, partial [Citrobacter portucalensis]
MYKRFRIVCLLMLLIASLCGQQVLAENCNSTIGDITINTTNIKYLPTLPNNTQLSHSMANNGSSIRFTCDLQTPKASWKRIIYKQKDIFGATTSVNGVHIFASTLKGLGYSLGFQCSGGVVRYIDDSTSPAGNQSVTICDSSELPNLLNQKDVMIKTYITFYKIGDVHLVSGNHTNAGGKSNVGELYIEQAANSSGSTTASSATIINLSALNIDIGSAGSCAVSSPDINVNMGAVNKSAFKGVGTTAGAIQSFSIPVFCTQPTDVRIGFFGQEASSSLSDTLALTRVSGAASGVGIRLSYGLNSPPAPAVNTPIIINDSSMLPRLR